MTKKEVEDEIDQLRDEIHHHDYLYYVQNEVELADAQYDQLKRRLEKMEEFFPGLITPDSPTQRVGAAPASEFKTVEHIRPMLSLDTADSNGLVTFDNRVKRELGVDEVTYVVEPKLDGLSVEIIYDDGIYSRGATRGDGQRGENVTENIKTILAVPLRLRHTNIDIPDRLVVRGEVIMHIDAFEDYNKDRIEKGTEPMANPRNAAAGSLRRLNPQETAERPLDIFFYEIMDLNLKGANSTTHQKALSFLTSWGLKVNKHTKLCKNVEDIVTYHQKMQNQREDLDYEIDGIVVKVNRFDYRERLGTKTRSPRWAIACKFPPRKEVTRIQKITVQVGRTGTITPVALLKPVDVKGVTVSRATLHNLDYVMENDIREGDWVKIMRAGDVIPEVVESLKEKRTGNETKFIMPPVCPVCGSNVTQAGAYYRCTGGLSCPAQLKRTIEHFGSKGAMDIEGLGGKTVDELVDRGLINNISDLYSLEKKDLAVLPRFADKSAENLLLAIEESKYQNLARVIYALGIPHVGERTSHLVADKYKSMEALRESSKEELQVLNEIGPEIAQSISKFFDEKQNQAVIDALKSYGVDMRYEKRTGQLQGITFVFTGTLKNISRKKAKEAVESRGGQVFSNLSNKVDYVVVGKQPGSKFEEAQNRDITTIDEEEFMDMVD